MDELETRIKLTITTTAFLALDIFIILLSLFLQGKFNIWGLIFFTLLFSGLTSALFYIFCLIFFLDNPK